MGASTGNMLVDDPEVLNEIFRVSPVPIITHCEDTPMINAELEKARARFGEDIPAREHSLIRSRQACIRSTRLAIELARKHGVSEGTIYAWKAKFGGMSVSDAQRLRALEDENGKLKRLLADAMLDKAALNDLLSKKW